MPRTPLVVNDSADVDKLVTRAKTLGLASDALWRAINADVDSSNGAETRFSHPLSSVAFRVEREASKAARVAQAAQRILARGRPAAPLPPEPPAVPTVRVPEPPTQTQNRNVRRR